MDNKASLVFFSGGTALNDTARALAHDTDTTHVITTFDSGGSTATLRLALGIPAVGDIRSRILALADKNNPVIVALTELLSYRFPSPLSYQKIQSELDLFLSGSHPLLKKLEKKSPKIKEAVLRDLQYFVSLPPAGFSYAEASFGNLILAAQYFKSGQSLTQAVAIISENLQVQGRVLPVTEDLAHLAVKLENGEIILGQHSFTGKWGSRINSPIESLWLTPSLGIKLDQAEAFKGSFSIKACPEVLGAIERATCICYPIGSFFSSVAANLLVGGVAEKIALAECPKVFVPNPGKDPELRGFSLKGQLDFLLKTLHRNYPEARAQDFISHLLVDKSQGEYSGGLAEDYLKARGIKLIDTSLIKEKSIESQPRIEGDLLAKSLRKVAGKDFMI